MDTTHLLHTRLSDRTPIDDEELGALLHAGADPNATDASGHTALFRAFAANFDEATIRRLARVTDMARASTSELTWWAVASGRLALYLEVGGAMRPSGDEPFVHVATLGLGGMDRVPETLQLLVALGEDPDARYYKARTPLFRLARADHIDAVRILLAAGADPLARDAKGDTPLVKAAPRSLRALRAQVAARAVAAAATIAKGRRGRRRGRAFVCEL